MKTIRSILLKNGNTQFTVELGKNEHLRAFDHGQMYKLGHSDGDIVPAEFLYDADLVQWCPFEQKWI